MDKILDFFKNLGTRFQELSPVNKAVALGLAALILGSFLAISLWVQQPDYQLLYANLSEEDAAAIVDELKTQNIPYELSNQGRTIRVPSPQVHELRLKLAAQGLPAGKEVGLELFEDTPLGMTDFVQKLNYQRALQGELARTIGSLDAVELARVHLVIPKEDVFIKDKPRGKASVMLKLRPGRSLNENQVQGIVHLVSSSVEGVQAKDVVVIDLKGNILSGMQDGTESTLLSATNFKHKRQVELALEKDIVKMLEEALGPGKVIAQVAADINFDLVEKTEEIYDPDSQVVRSEQTMTEQVTGAVPPGGVPGVQALLPATSPQAAPGGGTGEPPKRSNEKTTFNYEINKVVRHVRQPMGAIKKLSVAVLVDGTLAGDPPTYQARTPEQMAKLLELVKSAVGYDENRGDTIRLENVQFDRSEEEARRRELEQETLFSRIETGAIILGTVIIIVIFLLRILRPLVNWITTSVEMVPEAAALPSPEELEVSEQEKQLQKVAQQNMEIRKAVAEFVENDPKYAAGILRKWLRDRG